MPKWEKMTVGDLCDTISDTYRGDDKDVVLINTSDVLEGKVLNHQVVENKNLKGQFKKTFKENDILYSEIRPANKRYAFVDFGDTDNYIASTKLMVLRPRKDVVRPRFLFSFLASKSVLEELQQLAETRSGTFPQITFSSELAPTPINVPDLETQDRIVGILDVIEGKISTNAEINKNLEEQLSALFVNMFGHFIDSLDNSDIKLGDLIESVDNRGKTPPLSDEPTDYPIIDVRALSGNSRIIDYTNCTKYVSKETYNNWFRSGHPKEYDILISTVGSLAEMKIFLGTTGCIAQNVVGFRTKGISPLYLYQYLNYIKNDLVAYNIGSVQPSIKVTHIIKHSIYVASKEDIEIFDSIARDITKKIFANCQENEALKQMRDILLPKLMSGELDVSDIEI